jgi:hypothetical protein
MNCQRMESFRRRTLTAILTYVENETSIAYIEIRRWRNLVGNPLKQVPLRNPITGGTADTLCPETSETIYS